jgi:hypothetical protein
LAPKIIGKSRYGFFDDFEIENITSAYGLVFEHKKSRAGYYHQCLSEGSIMFTGIIKEVGKLKTIQDGYWFRV